MGKPGVTVTGYEKDLLSLIGELGDLGEPRWVMSRYGAAVKKAMQPTLAAAKNFAPQDSGNLRDSLAVTSRSKNGVSEARLGVDVQKRFLKKNKDGSISTIFGGRPVDYVASTEFGNKEGVVAQPFLRPAYHVAGKPRHILPIVKKELVESIKKRTKFLRKGVK